MKVTKTLGSLIIFLKMHIKVMFLISKNEKEIHSQYALIF